MQYFDLDDIAEHVIRKFPLLKPESVKKVIRGALTTMGNKSISGSSFSINDKLIRTNLDKNLDLYMVFMPSTSTPNFKENDKLKGNK